MVLLRSLVAPLLLVLTVLAFVFLVALGVDYNIFRVTRAREEAATRDPATGMLRALTATGGVITGAGILLAAGFALLTESAATGQPVTLLLSWPGRAARTSRDNSSSGTAPQRHR